MRLPDIRHDLRIFKAADSKSGAPSWTIYDPGQQSYYQIGLLELEIISRWHLGDAELIARKVAEQTALRPTADDIHALSTFLVSSGLAYGAGSPERQAGAKNTFMRKILDRLVFTRIPLLSPQSFLNRSIRYVNWVFSPWFRRAVFVLGLIAGYLLSRQWDAYLHQFSYMMSIEGIMAGLLVLAFSKICHELGHAYAATRAGIPVPEMGVALIVFWPLMYTNTTHAWRLHDRNSRITIDAAGVVTEMTLAVFFTLLWCLLPEGPLRGAAWYLSSTAWILTLVVNLNPLMRFDGYYLLADWLEMPNLMPRSIALARWWLRAMLFSSSALPPENLALKTRRVMIFYGMACLFYRAAVMFVIIGTIYYFFFKVLAIALTLAAFSYYIVLPVWKEIADVRRRGTGQSSGVLASKGALGLFCLALILLVPLPTTTRVPAVLAAAEDARIYSPVPARISEVHVVEGMPVKKGQLLLRLESPELDINYRKAEVRARALAVEISRQPAALTLRENHQVLLQRYAEVLAEISGIKEQISQLVVLAGHDGVAADLSDSLKVGTWVRPRNLLMRVIGSAMVVEGYVDEKDLPSVSPGVRGKMYLERPGYAPFYVYAFSVDPVAMLRVDRVMLSSPEGGGVDTQRNPRGELVPLGSIYRIKAQPDAESVNQIISAKSVLRGELLFEGPWKSRLLIWLRMLVPALLRESAF